MTNMKTIVATLLALFWGFASFAQNYAPDEVIIEYDAGVTETERVAVHNLYGVSESILLGDGIELWSVSFPVTIIEGGQTTTMSNLQDLLHYISVQEGENDDAPLTSNINNGDLNHVFDIVDSGALHSGGTFDPLPFCDAVVNDRLVGEDLSTYPNQDQIKIIIVDQSVDGITNIGLNSGPTVSGGQHGNKVYSVINNILTQAGLTGAEYFNIHAFHGDGTCTVATLVEVAYSLAALYEAEGWSPSDRILINFSANLVFPSEMSILEFSTILQRTWEKFFDLEAPGELGSVILISSAGNQGINTNNVFPGASDLLTEITVAGAQNCFEEPWSGTNHNPSHYEIAAEAVNVLTQSEGNYYLSSGTSFSSAMATAVLAQLALKNKTLSMAQIRNLLLNSADHIPALTGTVQGGKVLNIGNYSGNGGNKLIQQNAPATPLSATISPNPFTNKALINIQLEEGLSANVSLYNTIGQLVHQEYLLNLQELQELQWQTPAHLLPGTYFLRVQAGDEIQQVMVVKQ